MVKPPSPSQPPLPGGQIDSNILTPSLSNQPAHNSEQSKTQFPNMLSHSSFPTSTANSIINSSQQRAFSQPPLANTPNLSSSNLFGQLPVSNSGGVGSNSNHPSFTQFGQPPLPNSSSNLTQLPPNQIGEPSNQFGQPSNQFGQPLNQFGPSSSQVGQHSNQFGQTSRSGHNNSSPVMPPSSSQRPPSNFSQQGSSNQNLPLSSNS